MAELQQQKPVVVYAASGYTGRLVCEQMTKLGVPFVAAGRNLKKLEEQVRGYRAQGADCIAAACEHTPAGLQRLFRGAKIVVNVSGPFSALGHAVVAAALNEGCHYLDTTGEQDFMIDLQRDFGARFAREKLLLAPSTSSLWLTGTCAAEVCLETPGIDAIKVINAPPPLQTVASLQSMMRSGRRPGYVLVERELKQIPIGVVRKVLIPDTLEMRNALSIGAGEATYFMNDERVRNCETLFASDGLAAMAGMMKTWYGLSKYVSGDTLDKWSDALVLKYKKEPPPETPESTRYVVYALGEGNNRRVSVTVYGTETYVLTGYLCALASELLLEGKSQRVGYASCAHAFGARTILRRMEQQQGARVLFDAPNIKEAAATSAAQGAYSPRSA